MIRRLLIIAAAMLSTPAMAQTEHIVTGASPPSQYTVCAGDTLVLRKPMGREWLKADGSRAAGWSAWNDRSRSTAVGNEFETVGATKLAEVGYIAGKGYVYAPIDAQPCADTGPLFGANLSGAEASGGDSIRPSLEDLKNYIDRYGFGIIRYPFKDDRMTPQRIAEVKVMAAYAKSKGVPFILDNHTYRWDSVTKFVAFWSGFAANFPDDGSVMLDLVNEPRGFDDPVVTNDWDQWARDSNLIIAGLRANGIRHPILLEYPQWSATFRFDKNEGPNKATESAGTALDRAGGLKDPISLTYINGHRYFDRGSSGTNKTCEALTSGFVEFAAQLRKRNLKGVITESAFGSSYGVPASCVAVGDEAIKALKANGDVLKAVTWWGGGRIWPESYIFKIDGPKATRFTAPVSAYTRNLADK
jgi:hypothetical protein